MNTSDNVYYDSYESQNIEQVSPYEPASYNAFESLASLATTYEEMNDEEEDGDDENIDDSDINPDTNVEPDCQDSDDDFHDHQDVYIPQ